MRMCVCCGGGGGGRGTCVCVCARTLVRDLFYCFLFHFVFLDCLSFFVVVSCGSDADCLSFLSFVCLFVCLFLFIFVRFSLFVCLFCHALVEFVSSCFTHCFLLFVVVVFVFVFVFVFFLVSRCSGILCSAFHIVFMYCHFVTFRVLSFHAVSIPFAFVVYSV